MKTMRNWFFLAVGCLFLIFGLGAYFYPQPAAREPVRVFFDSAGGSVVFTHQRHAELSGISCEDCHHELLQSSQRYGCEKCHPDAGYSEGDMSHADLVDLHKHNCTGCHRTRKGDVSACRTCHGKTGEGKTASCETCHEGQGMNPADFSHDELEEIEGHYCGECHQTRRNSDALHAQCGRCHQDLIRGTFLTGHTEGQEAFQCALCHLKN
ncbi:hypothetical protein JXA40_03880 [bacterium]|nr:hypothetical protein [candidate division CSSED10-310 bacterium]